MSFHQTGPIADKKRGSPTPLEIHEKEKQQETANPKGFRILTEGASMPQVSLEHKEAAGATTKTVRAISEAKVYPKALPDTFDDEQNLHNQFVNEKFIQPDERKR